MKILRVIILLIMIFALILIIRFVFGGPEDGWICENNQWLKHGNPSYDKPLKQCGQNLSLPENEADCLIQGGQWRKIGVSPTESCDLPAIDAGRTCTDSNECQGLCLAELDQEEKEKAMHGKTYFRKGQCSRQIVVIGCQTVVNKGIVHGLTCID